MLEAALLLDVDATGVETTACIGLLEGAVLCAAGAPADVVDKEVALGASGDAAFEEAVLCAAGAPGEEVLEGVLLCAARALTEDVLEDG